MKNRTVLFVTKAAMIAAVYVVITIVLAPISFGQVQLRVSEALTIMPVFTAAAIPGVFIGCLIGNILGGAVLPDIIFGSLATLVAAVISYKLRGRGLLIASIPPVVVNMLVVPGAGEVVSCCILGVGLGKLLQKNKFILGDESLERKSEGNEQA